MTEKPKRPRGRPHKAKNPDARTDGRQKGSLLEKPIQEAKKQFIEEAEKIYRRYCRGMAGLEGAFAHVVKVLEHKGHEFKIEQIKAWARQNDWDAKVRDLDAKSYEALDDIKARRRALSPSGRADITAALQTVDDLDHLAASFIAKAQAAIEGAVVDTVTDIVTLARAAKDIAESASRVREALGRYVPPTTTGATADGKAVHAEVLSPPPASQAAPNLDAIVASFERGAKDPKH